MDQQNNPIPPQYPYGWQPVPVYRAPAYRAEGREIILAVFTLICGIFLWNSILNGGFSLGFALGNLLLLGGTVVYLLRCGFRPGGYALALLGFCAAIAAGFAWSDDLLIKLFLALLLIAAYNMALAITTGQNRYAPGSVTSLLDGPRVLFGVGCGGLERSVRGLVDSAKSSGKRSGPVLVGLLISVPLILVMVVLLMGADAAFEGLVDQLPEFDIRIATMSFLLGTFFAWLMYSRTVALRRMPRREETETVTCRVSPLTLNTVLSAVCLVYGVYLLSQLAYFWGGLSGILPEDFTLAEYARRGFFETAWLCAINLSCISLSLGLVKKDPVTPRLTRVLCLFIGLITVFFTVTACAKMLLYIDGYGLTRLRVLTQLTTLFLGAATVVVMVWIFCPKLPYMKIVMLMALALGTVTLWADVDTQVARYNVNAYRSGELATVDMDYLADLGGGALPYLEELTRDPDPVIAQEAKDLLSSARRRYDEDWQAWNYISAAGKEIKDRYPATEE